MIVVAHKETVSEEIKLAKPYWVFNVKKEGNHVLYLIETEKEKLEWFLASRFQTIEKNVSADLLKANKKLMRENKLYRRFLKQPEFFLFPIKIKKPLFLIKLWRKIWGK